MHQQERPDDYLKEIEGNFDIPDYAKILDILPEESKNPNVSLFDKLAAEQIDDPDIQKYIEGLQPGQRFRHPLYKNARGEHYLFQVLKIQTSLVFYGPVIFTETDRISCPPPMCFVARQIGKIISEWVDEPGGMLISTLGQWHKVIKDEQRETT